MKTNSTLGLYIGTAFVFFVLQFAFTAPYLSNGALFTTALLAASVIQDSRVRLLSRQKLATNLLLIASLAGAVFAGCFIYYAPNSENLKIGAGVFFLLSIALHLKFRPQRAKKKSSAQDTESKENESEDTTIK